MTSLRLVKSLFVVCYLYFTMRHHSLIFSKQLSTIYSLRHVNCKNFESIRALSNVWRSIISFLGRKFVVKIQQCMQRWSLYLFENIVITQKWKKTVVRITAKVSESIKSTGADKRNVFRWEDFNEPFFFNCHLKV